jgi:hypothetical protein
VIKTARLPNRQNQQKLATQSYGSKVIFYYKIAKIARLPKSVEVLFKGKSRQLDQPGLNGKFHQCGPRVKLSLFMIRSRWRAIVWGWSQALTHLLDLPLAPAALHAKLAEHL